MPAGFRVTTAAFERIVAEASSIDERLDRLSRLKPDDREGIRAPSAEIHLSVANSPLVLSDIAQTSSRCAGV